MRLYGVMQESLQDGMGCNLVVITQGCNIHCPGCHNKDLWCTEGGKVWTNKDIFSYVTGATSGITVSGGEPTLQGIAVLRLLQEAKEMGLKTTLYTGLTSAQWHAYEYHEEMESLLDFIKIGPFIQDLRDTASGLYGSTNQHLYRIVNGNYIKVGA